MLVSLLALLSQDPAAAPRDAQSRTGDHPVRVWFNADGDYGYGDRAKVYVRPAQDAYLVVLLADARGRVRVLFPIDPRESHRVSGGRKRELKGRAGREAFAVSDTTGGGIALAAVSNTPFRFDQFERNGHWDFRALADASVENDPEAGLMDLVRRMLAVDEHFDYDVATYVISAPRYARWRVRYPYPYPWPGSWYYGNGPRIGVMWRLHRWGAWYF
jgi:hypothetical protein